MKIQIAFLIIAASLTITLAANASWGVRDGKEFLLQQFVAEMPYKFLRKVVGTYKFDQATSPYPKRITYILVQDTDTSGKGGECKLANGGPPLTFVELRCKSQRNQGFKFDVYIYGY